MKKIPDEKVIQSWILLHRAHRKLLEKVEISLKNSSLPSLDWYDILLELHRVGNAGLRQNEIGKRILLSKHNLSRVIDRLEKKHLVSRHMCEEDGRGNQIRITNQGENVLKKVWPVYGQTIQTEFGDKLTDNELEKLAKILKKL